ncbi:MAG TPA: hypothetical protein VLC50_07285 [Actinomycetes bacterium]|nr:hypothetical protein [Actinomycetes bacterium]
MAVVPASHYWDFREARWVVCRVPEVAAPDPASVARSEPAAEPLDAAGRPTIPAQGGDRRLPSRHG